MIYIFRVISIAIVCTILSMISIITAPINSSGIFTLLVTKAFAGFNLWVSGVKLQTKGLENVDKKEKYIFVANHQSYFDISVLQWTIPNKLRFVYKKQINYVPIFGWAMYLAGFFPIDRSNARKAIELLRKASIMIKKKNISVAIFPEGTRSKDGTIDTFKKGIFILADEVKGKIVPVTITGTSKILPKNSFKINSGNVIVTYSKPLEFKSEKGFLNEIRDIIVKENEVNLRELCA